jgi:DNA-binding transcriptional MocR family regulator
MSSSAHNDSLIDLQKGWPRPSLLPLAQMQLAVATVLSEPSTKNAALQYEELLGDPKLRSGLAALCQRFR